MPAQAGPPAPPPKPILIDTVIATVNDSAIMLSALNTNRAGRLRAMMARYGRLLNEDIERVTREELEALIDRHTMAQAAKTFGVFPPEQVESFLRRELERDERELVRDFGSQQAYTRALEEQGRTWQTFVSEQRVDKLAGFAEQFSVDMRLQRQSNLFLTPRMLRETYEREHGRFVRPAEAIVGMVVFQGPDAADKAAAAAARGGIRCGGGQLVGLAGRVGALRHRTGQVHQRAGRALPRRRAARQRARQLAGGRPRHLGAGGTAAPRVGADPARPGRAAGEDPAVLSGPQRPLRGPGRAERTARDVPQRRHRGVQEAGPRAGAPAHRSLAHARGSVRRSPAPHGPGGGRVPGPFAARLAGRRPQPAVA